ncbi:FecR family protein [Xanthovirga aplysinae]|uniref:FecR family protein n=1 Tax=Xanthovirga aplysinae TaxID=2529853 RepID=UPI0012BD0D08|nr:FecR family protein [Xanthovirga aplysinae]MTI33478.1 FecR family protein [Xanthovirga aplysinae]
MRKVKELLDFEILWKKLHSSLNEEDERSLKKWMDEDQKHSEFFHRLKSDGTKGTLPFAQIDAQDSWEELVQKIEGGKKNSFARYLRFASGIAASLLLGIGGYWFWSPTTSLEKKVSEEIHSIAPGSKGVVLITGDGTLYELSDYQNMNIQMEDADIKSETSSLKYTAKKPPSKTVYHTLKVPRGGEFFLTLSDNSKVWLNSETTLKYPVTFSEDERVVELIGEAYFEVEKDVEKPFSVISEGQTVQVLGTAFNISSYPENADILTTLVEGKVKLFKTHTPDKSEILVPNSQGIFSKKTAEITQQKVEADKIISWIEGKLIFTDQRLEKMLETLSRWYDVKVIYQNEEVRGKRFTGTVKRQEDFKDVLRLIEKTNEVKFELKGNTLIVN